MRITLLNASLVAISLAASAAAPANPALPFTEPVVLKSPPLEAAAPLYPQPDEAALMQGFQREFGGLLEPFGAPKNRVSKQEFEGLVSQVRTGLALQRDASGKLTGKPVFGPGGFGMNQFLMLLQKFAHIHGGGSEQQRVEMAPMLADCLEHFNTIDTGAHGSWQNWANYGSMRPNFTYIYRIIQTAPQEIADTFAEKLFVLQALGYGMAQPNLQMDHLKGYGAEAIRLPIAIRDPRRRLAMVRKAHDYAGKLMLAPFNFTVEGGPMHHTIWHYYYGHYSTTPFFQDVSRYHRAGWHFPEAVYERIRRVGHAAAFIVSASNNVHPLNGGGRPGLVLNMGGGVAAWLDAAAQTGHEGNPAKYHPLHAAAFLHYFPGDARGKRYLDAGIKPAPMPEGHLSMNIGALASHRRKDWTVTVAGLSPATYKHEIYSWTQYNNYSQYARWGSHIISRPDISKSGNEGGFALSNGFNWAFIPGATCPATPEHRLVVRRAKSYISNGSMSGGCNLGGNGVWGQHQSGGPGANFKKSAFFFGERITFLTTNVSAVVPADATPGEKSIHTTLAQWPVGADSTPLLVDGKPVSSQPTIASVPLSKPVTLVDSKGNAYLVAPDPSASIQFRRGTQSFQLLRDAFLINPKVKPIDWHGPTIGGKRFDDQGLLEVARQFKPRTGDYEVAWIQHGMTDGSVAAGSTYHLLPFAGQQGADRLKTDLQADNPPCRILQRDAHAHVLRDRDSGVTGYVIFSNEPVTADGPVISFSNPGTAMTRLEKDGSLTLALAIPITRDPLDTRILVKGHHTLKPPAGQTIEITHLPDQTTSLRWLQHDYAANTFHLNPLR